MFMDKKKELIGVLQVVGCFVKQGYTFYELG